MLSKYFNKIPHVTDYHHFVFSSDEPGVVTCDKEKINIAKSSVKFRKEFPEEIVPPGFSDARKKYLYDEIRPFCLEGTKDIVAPKP